jgi:hypothetical protein
MAYTKTTWVNGQTPINETNLNHIEQGIYDNDQAISGINVPEVKTSNTTSDTDVYSCNYVNNKLQDTGWIELQTEQGFTPTSWNKLKYRKKNGIVCITGSVDLTEATSWTKLITTLPEGCRPPTELDIYCRSSNSGYPFMVAVNADGTIRTLSEIITGSDAGSGTIFIFITFIS